MERSTSFMITATALAASLFTCSKKNDKSTSNDANTSGAPGPFGSNTGALIISGTMEKGSSLNLLTDEVDAIVAVPTAALDTHGSIDSLLKSTDVGEDGSFAVHFDQGSGQDLVLLAIDTDAEDPLESIVGVVGMADEASSLLKMPMDAATADVALGDITASEADIVSETTIADNGEALGVAEEVLTEIAKTDDSIKHIKNRFANSKSSDEYYKANPYVTFSGALQNTVAGLSPEEVQYKGFGLYFSMMTDKASFDSVCDREVTLQVVPPETVHMIDEDRTTSPPTINKVPFEILSNEFVEMIPGGNRRSCGSPHGSNDGMFYSGEVDDTNYPGKEDGFNFLNFNFGAGGYDGPMPDGVWQLKLDEETVAKFDMSSAHPLDADGKPTVYIPTMKVEQNGGGIVTQLIVKFHLYDRTTGKFEHLKDLTAMLGQTKGDVNWGVTDYSGGCPALQGAKEIFERLENPEDGIFTVDLSSYGMKLQVPDSGDPSEVCEIESLSVSYSLNGTSLRFDLRYDWDLGS